MVTLRRDPAIPLPLVPRQRGAIIAELPATIVVRYLLASAPHCPQLLEHELALRVQTSETIPDSNRKSGLMLVGDESY